MRDTAIFCRTWIDAAAALPGEEFKQTILALAAVAFGGDFGTALNFGSDTLPPVGKTILTLATPIIRRNTEKWEARKKAGRPAYDITPQQVRDAVEECGTVAAAAEMLGISVRTAFRRLSVPKCQNAKCVNANANVNVNNKDFVAKATKSPASPPEEKAARPSKKPQPPSPVSPDEDKAIVAFMNSERWRRFSSGRRQRTAKIQRFGELVSSYSPPSPA